MEQRRGSVEILIAILVIVIIVAGAWLYFGRGNNGQGNQAANVPPTQQSMTTQTTNQPANNPPTTPANSADPTSQYILIHPTGTAAGELGITGSQFKMQFVAVTTIKTPGGSTWQYPFFNQYFYNEQTNTGWTYNLTSADGSGYLKAIGLSLDLYGSFPQLNMTYPVVDPDTGATDFVAAQKVILDDDGTITFNPVGSIHPTGRVVFAVPTEATETIVNYPGGTLTINLQDQTITAGPANPGATAPIQSGTVSVTAAPLSWYTPAVQTYTDSSGAFSVQYPQALTPDASVNGNQGSALDTEIVDISNPYAPGFLISSQVNAAIYGIDIQYSSPSDLATCENPDNEIEGGEAPPTIINGVNWYKTTLLSNNGTPTGGQQDIDDIYQTFQGKKCWAFDFNWDANTGQAPSYAAVSIFEESVLGTFRVLDASTLPDTE